MLLPRLLFGWDHYVVPGGCLLCKSAQTISSIIRTSYRENKEPCCPYTLYRFCKWAFQDTLFFFFFLVMILHIQVELGELQIQPVLISTVQDSLVVYFILAGSKTEWEENILDSLENHSQCVFLRSRSRFLGVLWTWQCIFSYTFCSEFSIK